MGEFDYIRRLRRRIAEKVERGHQIRFWDNGPGISEENLRKIFDPFFTTKDVGQGTGLGLSICHRIVQDYGGQIRVNSEAGAYCEFALEFPGVGAFLPDSQMPATITADEPIARWREH